MTTTRPEDMLWYNAQLKITKHTISKLQGNLIEKYYIFFHLFSFRMLTRKGRSFLKFLVKNAQYMCDDNRIACVYTS